MTTCRAARVLHVSAVPLAAVSLAALLVAVPAGPARGAATVGLMHYEPALAGDGYTLFAPMRYTTTYLIDMYGRLVHAWPATQMPGLSAYLTPEGHLLRTANSGGTSFNAGGAGGRVQEFDWDGTLLWDYTYSSTSVRQHHDVQRLPNGDVLLVAWERKTQTQAVAAGRDPALVTTAGLWLDHLVQVRPTGPTSGTIVWEWHLWDHLVQDLDAAKANYGSVATLPGRVNFNAATNSGSDWTHVNGIDYDAAHDQIVLSAHNLGEFWVIDHATTTAEAAGHTGGARGHGGDILYRWGNPAVYGRGGAADQELFGQHDAQWIPAGVPGAGHFLVFNNGAGRGWSTVDEIASPADAAGNFPADTGGAFGPAAPTWSYAASPPTSFFAQNISGAQRLPNGNTLVCDGPGGTFFEVTPAGAVVWEYVNPVVNTGPLTQGDPIPSGSGGQQNTVFRAARYAPDFSGFVGRDLTPQGTIELGGTSAVGETPPPVAGLALAPPQPNPTRGAARLRWQLSRPGRLTLVLLDTQGRLVRRLLDQEYPAGSRELEVNLTGVVPGTYFLVLQSASERVVQAVTLAR